jgi:hypothetical protein
MAPMSLHLYTATSMDNNMFKRLMWSALLAGFGALSSIVAQRGAGVVWRRMFGEEPPE